MTIESAVADLTTATTTLTTAVNTSQTTLTSAISGFAATTATVAGLNNVTNTSDANKPVSAATATALGLKQNTLVSGVNISTVNGVSLLSGSALVIARSATSLTSLAYDGVTGRAALRTNATQPQVDDSVVIEALGLFMFVETRVEPDDDETCFTPTNALVTTGQWLLQTPAWDLIDAWNLFEKSVTDDFIEDVSTKLSLTVR